MLESVTVKIKFVLPLFPSGPEELEMVRVGWHCRNKTETLFPPWFAVTRSSAPSPLKSPTATEPGVVPTLKFAAVPKAPVPVPSKTETSPELALAAMRSCLPSLSISPTATELGLTFTGKLVAALKPPVPSPNKTEMS